MYAKLGSQVGSDRRGRINMPWFLRAARTHRTRGFALTRFGGSVRTHRQWTELRADWHFVKALAADGFLDSERSPPAGESRRPRKWRHGRLGFVWSRVAS